MFFISKHRHQNRRIKSRSQEQGFTLLEVLISLLVLAIGLLGLAGLQTVALSYNHSAYLRTQATFLAYDMLDRARANRDEAMGGSYNLTINSSPTAGTNCTTSSCNQAAMAGYDKAEWKNSLKDLLPGGNGSVQLLGNNLVITVQWKENRVGTTDTPSLTIRSEI